MDPLCPQADLLLSYGYEDDLKSLTAHIPRRCQCLLMSATSRCVYIVCFCLVVSVLVFALLSMVLCSFILCLPSCILVVIHIFYLGKLNKQI